MKHIKWTNKQIVRLRECYPKMSMNELIKEFARTLGDLSEARRRDTRLEGAAGAKTGRPSAGPT